jgi:hypothetical protein
MSRLEAVGLSMEEETLYICHTTVKDGKIVAAYTEGIKFGQRIPKLYSEYRKGLHILFGELGSKYIGVETVFICDTMRPDIRAITMEYFSTMGVGQKGIHGEGKKASKLMLKWAAAFGDAWALRGEEYESVKTLDLGMEAYYKAMYRSLD